MMPKPSLEREQRLAAWLDGILGPGWVARPLAGDASFRRYLRVSDAAGRTWVLMDAPPDKEDVGRFEQVGRLLAGAGIRVPAIEAGDRRAGFLLLSDLGDELYLGRLSPATADPLYARALSTLVRIQAEVPAESLPAYDRELLRGEMELFPAWFLCTHLGYELHPGQRAALLEAFSLLEVAAGEQPCCFVHRDYHSRNLMVCDDALGVLDFQDAVRGPVTYDLVSLLRDVYVEWPPARVDGWIELYRKRATGHVLPASVEAPRFRRWFDLMGVQRHLKIAGIFARLWHRDGKPGYLSHLPLTLRYLAAQTGAYPELASLHALVQDVRARFSERELSAGRR